MIKYFYITTDNLQIERKHLPNYAYILQIKKYINKKKHRTKM